MEPVVDSHARATPEVSVPSPLAVAADAATLSVLDSELEAPSVSLPMVVSAPPPVPEDTVSIQASIGPVNEPAGVPNGSGALG